MVTRSKSKSVDYYVNTMDVEQFKPSSGYIPEENKSTPSKLPSLPPRMSRKPRQNNEKKD